MFFFNVRGMSTNGLPRKWTVADSSETYGIKAWSQGYFSINDVGHVVCHPQGPEAGTIDLKDLVDEVVRRGINLPLLIRFSDILKSRVVELHEAFRRAIADFNYKGDYRGVYRSRSTSTATWSRRSSSSAAPTTMVSR